ncbi:lactosylceramide 4-alpha-galactosyltransferase-like [Frankliniella occidentalis]|uniref:Lactosylceramide 4-alpha-galactosyltransferase-like n=1 Tax=Frankliniella occidentalis TaxID=133901 RepID=A0A6J1T770_FRAOC|nr:lactosylceramide 4-alpha-galactosyltransferase-like [Frankliniella occidentalis]
MTMKHSLRGRWLLALFAFVLLLTILTRTTQNFLLTDGRGNRDISSHSAPIKCYDDTTSNQIEDVNDMPPSKDSIFFHETSCASADGSGDFVFTSRQACAVESAAKSNPNTEVNVLFLSPINLKNISHTQNLAIKALLSYPNIKIKHVSMERYMQDTPLEGWYKSRPLQRSLWPTSHASDVMRYLTLWKYSGTYLDLDVVVLKSLSNLRNYAGAESPRALGAGIINLDSSSIGRAMAHAFLNELYGSFNGADWGANGPGVVTRVLRQMCQVKKVQDMTPERCGGFTIHPPIAFYPISFEDWEDYFNEDKSDLTMKMHADSYVAHLSNKFSMRKNVTVGSKQPYGLLAAEHCPKVFSTCQEVF